MLTSPISPLPPLPPAGCDRCYQLSPGLIAGVVGIDLLIIILFNVGAQCLLRRGQQQSQAAKGKYVAMNTVPGGGSQGWAGGYSGGWRDGRGDLEASTRLGVKPGKDLRETLIFYP